MGLDTFDSRGSLQVGDRTFGIRRLDALAGVGRLPYSLRILLENLLRTEDGANVTADAIEALANWDPQAAPSREIQFTPARVIMQDFTGVPCIVDLAAMREAMRALGGDPAKINPLAPAELVIDHSIIADVFGRPDAFLRNAEIEFARNRERYQFLRWGQEAFANLVVVPPNTGIVHQVNLERLARVVFVDEAAGPGGAGGSTGLVAYPDTLVGTDSHTTMINGLGVLGWGVGGIEAEAAMLGQPVSMLIPNVVGFRLTGEMAPGTTATDLVLTVTEMLRRHGVVGKFVEFYGAGLAAVPLADRATIGNMSPEYGSTCAIFPIDAETLSYLRFTGRPPELVALVEAYAKEQGLWHEPAHAPDFTETIELDLATIEPSLAGPKRPQDRVPLRVAKAAFRDALRAVAPAPALDGLDEASEESFPASDPAAAFAQKQSDQPAGAYRAAPPAAAGAYRAAPPKGLSANVGEVGDRPSVPTRIRLAEGTEAELDHGAVVIAAITSCTNTSNPQVMVGAGLLAKNAVERGLTSKPWVKTSLAPGSKVVMDYYDAAGLTPYLEKLGFHLVGYGCTTCIGNSGPLPDEVADGVHRGDLAVVSVLSGNRNFEGRINPDVTMNYLASPPLVVAYALAGTMDIDLDAEPLGTGSDGQPVFLSDIWPASADITRVVGEAIKAEMFSTDYADVFAGDDRWRCLPLGDGGTGAFSWDPESTYVRRPPYFDGMPADPQPTADVVDARVLALLADSVTTDHISPAGSIKKDSPAARYLLDHGVDPHDFNSYGSRRGNHEVMIRGTFANIRLRNKLAPGTQGGVTLHLPDGEQMTIYDAAMRYAEEGVPLVVLAGKEYGSGSSRDWAAKGTALLGVRTVIAESYERIHRSNLIGMGVLPLQFPDGQSAESLGLTGHESITIRGLGDVGDKTGTLPVRAGDARFEAVVRIDTPGEAEYFRHGGILPYVLRSLRGS